MQKQRRETEVKAFGTKATNNTGKSLKGQEIKETKKKDK